MPRILIIDNIHPHLSDTLTAKGFDCVDGSGWERSRYLVEIAAFDGLVLRTKIKVDKAFIDKATKLRFIARAVQVWRILM